MVSIPAFPASGQSPRCQGFLWMSGPILSPPSSPLCWFLSSFFLRGPGAIFLLELYLGLGVLNPFGCGTAHSGTAGHRRVSKVLHA